jgi:hypothetical protein
MENQMKHYINKNKEIFGFELDGSQDYLITEDMKEISLEEIAELNKPTEAQLQEQVNAEARAMLNSLDWKVIRELERLMLNGTDLNIEREALRVSIV